MSLNHRIEVIDLSRFENRFMPPKLNPLFSNIYISKLYEFCKDRNYIPHCYNVDHDIPWMIVSTKSGALQKLTIDSDTFNITVSPVDK